MSVVRGWETFNSPARKRGAEAGHCPLSGVPWALVAPLWFFLLDIILIISLLAHQASSKLSSLARGLKPRVCNAGGREWEAAFGGGGIPLDFIFLSSSTGLKQGLGRRLSRRQIPALPPRCEDLGLSLPSPCSSLLCETGRQHPRPWVL